MNEVQDSGQVSAFRLEHPRTIGGTMLVQVLNKSREQLSRLLLVNADFTLSAFLFRVL